MKIYSEDTIASISTPLGENGIGIVRLSGEQAVEITKKIFRAKNAKIPLNEVPTHTLHYGYILANGTVIDEVLVTVMRAPKTYTREDVVEINCHGGIVPLTKVLELCLKNGARLAKPGEFTQRAFLNGRIDLAQAEAVCDLIRAKTELASKVALQQLEGNLSKEIRVYREELISLLAHLEVSLDYAEEGIEFLSSDEIEKKVTKILSQIEKLLESANTGKILREGLKTAIVGKPNVGKSSLLNILLREERAIVTPLPGTTRDIIEETVNLRGIPLVIMDTAGIRKHSQDLVEKIGIERSKKTVEEAELILFVIDLSQPLSEEDIYIAKLINEFNPQTKVIIVGNKVDLPQVVNEQDLVRLQITLGHRAVPESLGERGSSSGGGDYKLPVIKISATLREGIEKLEEEIYQRFIKAEFSQGDTVLITNLRHKESLLRAKESLLKAREAGEKKLSSEFIALDLRQALDSLGEVIGETVTEDILDRIFSQFCVGK